MRDVVVPPVEVEVAQGATTRGVLHHDDAPRLAIAAGRRESCVVENLEEGLVAHRLVEERSHRTGGAQRVAQVHGVTLGLRY